MTLHRLTIKTGENEVVEKMKFALYISTGAWFQFLDFSGVSLDGAE